MSDPQTEQIEQTEQPGQPGQPDDYFYEESNYNSSGEEEPVLYDPNKLTPQYHIQQAETALQNLKILVNDPGWKKEFHHKNGVMVYNKPGISKGDKLPVFMGEHVIDGFSPQSIFAVIGMRKLWDDWYEEGSLVENLNETTSLTYMVMQALAGSKTRDLSLVEKIECTENGAIYFAATSVETPKVPSIANRIRAQIQLNGWILEPLDYDPPKTKVTYVLQTKINGWVPSILAKTYLSRRPLVLHTIDQYLKKNGSPPLIIGSTPPASSRPSISSNFNFVLNNNHNSDDTEVKTPRRKISFTAISDFGSKILNSTKHHHEISVSTREIQNGSLHHQDNSRSSKSPSSSTTPSSPIQQTSSSTIQSSPFQQESSTTTQSSPIQQDSLITPQSLPIQQDSPTTVQSSPIQQESSTTVQSSPIQQESSTTVQSSPIQQDSSKTEQLSTIQQDSTITAQTLPIQQPSSITAQSSPIQQDSPTTTTANGFSLSQPENSPKPIQHRHTVPIQRALDIFNSHLPLNGWNFNSENKTVKIYAKEHAGKSTPIMRGDSVISGGFTTYDILCVIINLDTRKLWDDRYDEGATYERFSLHEHLTRTAMKGTFPISGRDLSVCGILDCEEDTGTLQFVTTSVVDPLIPESKKHVRSNLNFAGWRLEPHFDAYGNTTSVDVTYIVDIDIKLDSVPSSILKMLSNQIPTTISKIDELMQKSGFPPYILKADTKILTEEFNIKNYQYDLSLLPGSGCVTEFKISKSMYPNGIDVCVLPENCKVELLPTSAETIRVTLPLKVASNTFTITVSKRSKGFQMTYNNGQEIPLAIEIDSDVIPIRKEKPAKSNHNTINDTISNNATFTNNNNFDEAKYNNP
ncbi:8341_t:CDS:2, partial [Funneliformis geosporum]